MMANDLETLENAMRHMQKGRWAEASALFEQVLAGNPRDFAALHMGGIAKFRLGDAPAGIEMLRRAQAIDSTVAEMHANLGNMYLNSGKLDDALAAYERAIELQPDFAAAMAFMSAALLQKNDLERSVAVARRSVELEPQAFVGWMNLGTALKQQGNLDGALDAFRRARKANPQLPSAFNNLADVYKAMGQVSEAVTQYQRALALPPNSYHYFIYCDFILALHYWEYSDASLIAQHIATWSQLFAEPHRQFQTPHSNTRDPNRRLKVGYISADLRDHAVGRFLVPLLKHHDRSQVEVFCYAANSNRDAITERLHSHADQWREVRSHDDRSLAGLIRRDQIDILVDLSLHTALNRLMVFAMKPAPVQVTYLSYCSTSGMSAMDYRLTDAHLDPPGGDFSNYTERSVSLRSYWCYDDPGAGDSSLDPSPARRNGYITFGYLNNFCKINDRLLKLWGDLLRRLPDSRLAMVAPAGIARSWVLEMLGVSPQRVRFEAYLSRADYFKLYDQIDIALDPIPYGGGTTTCDALWMGVPVVTRRGKMPVGRGGASILSQINLTELIADSEEQYVQLLADLAADLPRLEELRRTLRSRMKQSPLMDGKAFAADVERAYQLMWRQWCESGS